LKNVFKLRGRGAALDDRRRAERTDQRAYRCRLDARRGLSARGGAPHMQATIRLLMPQPAFAGGAAGATSLAETNH